MSSLLLRAGGCLESRALQHECLSLHLGCRAVCHQGLCLLTGSDPWEGCALGGGSCFVLQWTAAGRLSVPLFQPACRNH